MTTSGSDITACPTCDVELIDHRCPECGVSDAAIVAWRRSLEDEEPDAPPVADPAERDHEDFVRRRLVIAGVIGVILFSASVIFLGVSSGSPQPGSTTEDASAVQVKDPDHDVVMVGAVVGLVALLALTGVGVILISKHRPRFENASPPEPGRWKRVAAPLDDPPPS